MSIVRGSTPTGTTNLTRLREVFNVRSSRFLKTTFSLGPDQSGSDEVPNELRFGVEDRVQRPSKKGVRVLAAVSLRNEKVPQHVVWEHGQRQRQLQLQLQHLQPHQQQLPLPLRESKTTVETQSANIAERRKQPGPW